MHIVHCDLVVGLPKALDGSYAILLLYDGFSRFTFGIPLASEKADYVVKKLMSHFIAAFGLPWALHSDNGRNVDGSFIRHLALMLGVLKTSTPPHTPNANPTETMCGAVSMLLRKALNDSDKRYWSQCLPFVLNALNSTVHTATGYTPNSLFFGRYKERDPVPLIPFDSESVNVNEYFQKMRRFQELAFQIVRSRNERKLLARKDALDSTAKPHTFKEGDFVLVKNKNPASGPGKMKLRAKYVGPFRVIKAYTSSLIVVPWTENSRLDEYYKDPNIFRLIHRGDIKPFYTRQVAVKHCKPFKGDIEAEQIIDPIMLTRFLDMLGVDSQDDLISEIDPKKDDDSSTDSRDSFDSHPRRPRRGPPRGPPARSVSNSDDSYGSEDDDDPPDIPQIDPEPDVQEDNPDIPDEPDLDQAPDVPEYLPLAFPDNLGAVRRRVNYDVKARNLESPIDKLVNNLEASRRTKETLKDWYRKQADLPAMSAVARGYHERIKELEVQVRNSDPGIRKRAEYELQEVTDMIKNDLAAARDESRSNSSLDLSSDDGIVSVYSQAVGGSIVLSNDSEPSVHLAESLPSVHPAEEDNLADELHLEWDHEAPLAGSSNESQEINIKTPNVSINIRPNVAPTAPKRLGTWKRAHSGITVRDINRWLDEAAVEQNQPDPEPIVTKSGRVSKPPLRYSQSKEDKRERELKDEARNRATSIAKAKEDRKSQAAPAEKSQPVASTSARPPSSVTGRNTSIKTRASTTGKSVPSQKTKSTWK